LHFATLSGANLEMADLSDADLSDARLDGVNLSGADLCNAQLERADFAKASLVGANLAGASLKDARNLTQGQIDQAFGDASTLLPPYLVRPQGWGSSQPISGLWKQNESPQDNENDSAPQSRGEAKSWLVGGPARA
jgi:hypothetical protein